MPATTTRKVPAAALELRVPFELAAGEGQPDPMRGKVQMVARSGEPIDHWYWGRLVHDLSGMRVRDRVALDWCHDQDEPLGYADSFDIASGDLVVTGELIATGEDDRAVQVLAKGRAGVPYQASIKFGSDGIRLEELRSGYSAEVNGRTIEGPATIVREWSLQGIAVCLYGYDPRTETNFARGESREHELTVHQLNPEGSEMTKAAADPGKPAADPGVSAETQLTADQVREQLTTQLADYTRRFGAAHGTEWALAAKPLAECYELHVAELTAQHSAAIAAKDTELAAAAAKTAELQAKIDQLSLGETKAVSSTPAEQTDVQKRAAELSKNTSEGVAAWAASLKLTRPAA